MKLFSFSFSLIRLSFSSGGLRCNHRQCDVCMHWSHQLDFFTMILTMPSISYRKNLSILQQNYAIKTKIETGCFFCFANEMNAREYTEKIYFTGIERSIKWNNTLILKWSPVVITVTIQSAHELQLKRFLFLLSILRCTFFLVEISFWKCNYFRT